MSDSDTARRVDRARTDVRGHTMSRAARWKLLAAGPRSWGLGDASPPPQWGPRANLRSGRGCRRK